MILKTIDNKYNIELVKANHNIYIQCEYKDALVEFDVIDGQFGVRKLKDESEIGLFDINEIVTWIDIKRDVFKNLALTCLTEEDLKARKKYYLEKLLNEKDALNESVLITFNPFSDLTVEEAKREL